MDFEHNRRHYKRVNAAGYAQNPSVTFPHLTALCVASRGKNAMQKQIALVGAYVLKFEL